MFFYTIEPGSEAILGSGQIRFQISGILVISLQSSVPSSPKGPWCTNFTRKQLTMSRYINCTRHNPSGSSNTTLWPLVPGSLLQTLRRIHIPRNEMNITTQFTPGWIFRRVLRVLLTLVVLYVFIRNDNRVPVRKSYNRDITRISVGKIIIIQCHSRMTPVHQHDVFPEESYQIPCNKDPLGCANWNL